MKFKIEDFEVDDNKVLSCPNGIIPIESHIINCSSMYYAKFEAKNCCRCEFKEKCCAHSQGKYYIVREQNPNRVEQDFKKIVPQLPDWVKKLQNSIPKNHSLYIPEKPEIKEAIVIGNGIITEYGEGGIIKNVKPMASTMYR